MGVKKIQIVSPNSTVIPPHALTKILLPIVKGLSVQRNVKKAAWIVAVAIVPASIINAELIGPEKRSGVKVSFSLFHSH